MINTFLNVVKEKANDTAFIVRKSNKLRYITYQTVLEYIYKGCNLIKNVDGPIILFTMPSFELYIMILAALYSNKKIVFIDSFKDKNKLKSMVSKINATHLLVNNITNILAYGMTVFKDLQKINIHDIDKQPINEYSYEESTDKLLYTFTSGTTSDFKLISRSLSDLSKQLDVIKSTFNVESNIILCGFPIYLLANLLLGKTNYIMNVINHKTLIKELKYLKEANVDTYMASVSKLLKINKEVKQFKYIYTGGSKVTLKDALTIQKTFNTKNINYIYGASEANIITRTCFDDYIASLKNNNFCVGDLIPGIDVMIDVLNEDGVGDILVKSKHVFNTSGYINTNDLGFIKDNKLYILGRTRYANIEEKLYPFTVEQTLLNNFNELKNVCYIYYNGHNYLFYEGKLNKEQVQNLFTNDFILKKTKLKRDIRHKYKFDYQALIKLIK